MADMQPPRSKWVTLVKGIKVNHISLAVKILLPTVDIVTDVYTLSRYYDPEKSFMQMIFYVSFITILFHNIISGIHGVYYISRMNKESNLVIWSDYRWKSLTAMLYFMGLGSIVCPIEVIRAIRDQSIDYSKRY